MKQKSELALACGVAIGYAILFGALTLYEFFGAR
jgi:hypothetical protein